MLGSDLKKVATCYRVEDFFFHRMVVAHQWRCQERGVWGSTIEVLEYRKEHIYNFYATA